MLGCSNGSVRSILTLSKAQFKRCFKAPIRKKTDSFPLPKGLQLIKEARKGHKQPKQRINPRDIPRGDDQPIFLSTKTGKQLETSLGPNDATEHVQQRSRKAVLSNVVETFVNSQVPQICGLSTEQLLADKSTPPSDVYSFLPAYITRGTRDSYPIKLLWSALENILPPDPLNSNVVTPRGKFAHRQWCDSEVDLDATVPNNRMNLGWHLPMFPYPVRPENLLRDGTDARFVPGPPEKWPYRLWAGGSIKLHTWNGPTIDGPFGNSIHHMIERPQNLRVAGKPSSQRAFVTIRKLLYALEGRISVTEYTKENIMSLLTRESSSNAPYAPILEEEYTLCFLQDKPRFDSTSSKVVPPLAQPKLSHTLTPNRHLLFAWSAITCNAHLIHLDPTFAREEYGAPNLLVHGPLTVFLILEWFQRALTQYVINRLDKFHLVSIQYQNIAPLYVDEPMNLCAKPTVFQTPGTLAPSWEVWIEKTYPDGTRTMAFKGQIKLASKPFNGEPVQLEERHQHQEDAKPEPETDAGAEFKSPFFS